ncbi:MAG: chemotaxis protein [Burkholderiales bacterium RIFCSPHIGHO2_12_FULL_65_48]|nr:MAG: chemotaxis protein [Burkholderiales bacterium RIFCSPHIGHO2_02_FULL_64_19]OGB15881.1 MAG: chemotaxis protein [Burkholderiales bacterium RIFCSPHIGHO2_12_FULL_65_48]OGB52930.1 MAG: chemotaxis protein [Burkholderiales bacterium RIFCSPLOWO2_12_FULL_64_33]
MNKSVMAAIFAVGLAVVGWVGWGFVGSSPLALAMTVVIAAVYVVGAYELMQFRAATSSLSIALAGLGQQPLVDLGGWLERLHSSLRNPVRQRIDGERVPLPGPALAPYLVGLLVMLGMLGTFLGMVVTFNGAVFALEASSSLESIRAALAAPIKGLGLSFGTSVAGVAASAMLGLMSALCRRERLAALRTLDARIASELRPFSAAHRRQEMFEALQAQAQAMPLIAERLQGLMEGLERRHEQLNGQLQDQQQVFHREAAAAYTQLATTVGASLHDSLGASARMAGETIRPVVEQAMATLAQEAERSHQRLREATGVQMHALTAQWEGTARQVADTWTEALDRHTQTQDQQAVQLGSALQSITQTLEQRTTTLLATLQETVAQSQAAQLAADQQRLAGWSQSMEGMASRLAEQWQLAGEQTAQQQRGVCQALEGAATQLDQSLQTASQAFEQRTTALLASLQETVAQSQAAQLAADQQRLASWSRSMEGMASTLAERWQQVGEQTAQHQQGVCLALEGAATQLDQSLQTASQAFEQRTTALLASLEQTVEKTQADQAVADQQRLAGWSQSMEGMASRLAEQWQQVGEQTAQHQRGVCQALEGAAAQLTERMTEQVHHALVGAARLMDQSDALLHTRIEAEARWADTQAQRMDALAGVWRTELVALRDAEAARGQAAVERLDALQAAVAGHLATLGSALEAPLTRLLQTASDVPQAAAEVITQLRQEMTHLSERDNAALAERTAMMEQLGVLLQSVNEAAGQQRAAIESLVGSAASVLEQAGQEFAQALGAQAGKVDEVSAHVAASAVELSSLGESFGHGVELFTASNEKLMDSLQRIEGAIGQSMSRSDEQLAYYVAQAREVIDLSISSQQGIVEDLRRLNGQMAAAVQGVTA